jgi:hypothetical protein
MTAHDGAPGGYGSSMSHMADHERERPVEVEGVPEGEGISRGDAAGRVDEEPDEQPNRRDPVWHDEDAED